MIISKETRDGEIMTEETIPIKETIVITAADTTIIAAVMITTVAVMITTVAVITTLHAGIIIITSKAAVITTITGIIITGMVAEVTTMTGITTTTEVIITTGITTLTVVIIMTGIITPKAIKAAVIITIAEAIIIPITGEMAVVINREVRAIADQIRSITTITVILSVIIITGEEVISIQDRTDLQDLWSIVPLFLTRPNRFV
jgi:hypothetical protein